MARKKKEAKLPILVMVGLLLLFYNNIVEFIQNVFGAADWQARVVLFFVVLGLVYYKTPWIKTILRG